MAVSKDVPIFTDAEKEYVVTKDFNGNLGKGDGQWHDAKRIVLKFEKKSPSCPKTAFRMKYVFHALTGRRIELWVKCKDDINLVPYKELRRQKESAKSVFRLANEKELTHWIADNCKSFRKDGLDPRNVRCAFNDENLATYIYNAQNLNAYNEVENERGRIFQSNDGAKCEHATALSLAPANLIHPTTPVARTLRSLDHQINEKIPDNGSQDSIQNHRSFINGWQINTGNGMMDEFSSKLNPVSRIQHITPCHDQQNRSNIHKSSSTVESSIGITSVDRACGSELAEIPVESLICTTIRELATKYSLVTGTSEERSLGIFSQMLTKSDLALDELDHNLHLSCDNEKFHLNADSSLVIPSNIFGHHEHESDSDIMLAQEENQSKTSGSDSAESTKALEETCIPDITMKSGREEDQSSTLDIDAPFMASGSTECDWDLEHSLQNFPPTLEGVNEVSLGEMDFSFLSPRYNS